MPSVLRLAGVVIGLAFILIAVAYGRRAANRSVVVLLVLAGVATATISIVPSIVEPLQALLGLGGAPSGRILTVVVVSSVGAYVLLFYAIAKGERTTQRVRRLIGALSAAQVESATIDGRLGGILVCIPAFNESVSLPGVIDEIPSTVAGLDTHVLVIDDASSDGTRAVALAHDARVVSHAVNGGQGAALQTGYLVAERLGTDIVVTLDADGQHDPGEMVRLVQPIVDDEADFVVGSRRAGAYEVQSGRDGLARNAGITVYTKLLNALGGTELTDVANGYRAIRARALSEIAFTEDQFHNPELLIWAAREGLRIVEVPVTIRRRSAGASKKGSTLRYGVGFLRVIIRSWLR